MSTIDVLDTVVSELDAGRRAALCVIVAKRGSTPQPPGTMVCVDELAGMTGTLGGGRVEADVRRQARQLLSAGRSKLITLALDDDLSFADGMICGGQIDVAVAAVLPTDLERYKDALHRIRAGHAVGLPVRVDTGERLVEYRVYIDAEPSLVIVGGGHIGRILAGMTAPLGFRVHVVDDRADYANAERFPPPMQTTVGDMAATLKSWPVDANTYIVIVTRGHRHDEDVLQAVLEAPAKYVGMIGSRSKVKTVFDDLRRDGATEAQLSRVHAPIGLDINSVTPEEISLSIAAQLVSVRRADHHKVVEGPIPVSNGA